MFETFLASGGYFFNPHVFQLKERGGSYATFIWMYGCMFVTSNIVNITNSDKDPLKTDRTNDNLESIFDLSRTNTYRVFSWVGIVLCNWVIWKGWLTWGWPICWRGWSGGMNILWTTLNIEIMDARLCKLLKIHIWTIVTYK